MEVFGFDAFSPKEIAARVEAIGVTKARLPLLAMAMLGMCAGGFIGLGAIYYTLIALIVRKSPALVKFRHPIGLGRALVQPHEDSGTATRA